MTSLLVVSPHLDDAVLSCGGAIHAAARGGRRVVVLTVFTAGDSCAVRRHEDREAVASLGGEVVHLGLLDAPERLGLPRTHRALVEEAPVFAADVMAVRAAIEAVIGETRPSSLWAPLGVGGHVDHRVVFEALRAGSHVTFYEERPYAFLPGAVRARVADLGYRLPADLADVPAASEVREALETLPYIRAYASGADRDRACDWLAAHIASAEARQPGSGLELLATVTSHGEETAVAVAHAVAMYRSQTPDLFGGPGIGAIGAALRGAAPTLGRGRGPHAERTFSTAATRRGTERS